MTMRADRYCNHQVYPTPVVLSVSTILGQAGHCQPLQSGFSSWSGSTLVEQCAGCIAVDNVKNSIDGLVPVLTRYEKVSIFQAISIACRMSSKFRKCQIFNNQFWCFQPVTKLKDLMFSKV